ncbi:MAG: hypothetical protein GQ564_20520 [Bacteroidales bacterium]|nr:hypothetical protein [Bacteroidales bacterium]
MKKHNYFLGKILFVLLLMILIMSSAKSQTTYYSYKSGTWNDIDTWTTDPGGTTLVGNSLPTDGDNVVILMSRTVTLTADTTTTTLDITINSGGILDIGDYSFTDGLTALRGEGTLRLSSANFPTATTNTFVQTGGGTTEYYNSSNFTLLATQTEYNNLTLDLSTTSIIATQLSDITLNGDLLIKVGIYQINDASPNRRQLTINGNVTVNSSSSLTVGTGVTNTTTNPYGISGGTAPFIDYYDAQSHRVAIYGDFTNNGTVSFTNLTYPVYDAFPSTTEGITTGFATVYFLGASDNTLTCNSTTDFYNLVVDKGTDQTYQLAVNSSDYPYFRLFGANTSGGEDNSDNPLLKKALWLRNGTLRLFGKVVIPSLSEGTCDAGMGTPVGPNSDYFIPANAALVVDGPDVIVLTTADDYTEINAAYSTTGPNNAAMGVNSSASCSSFSILGKFQIDDGYISTRESGGFIYWASSSGEFIINGGTLDAKQFRTANASGGLTAYRQTGGTFNLRGRIKNDVSGVSTVADLTAVPLSTTQSTGGIQPAVGTFNIDRDDNIFEMTGGIIKIYDVCGISGGISRAYEVNCLPAYYSVSGGEVQIIPTAGTDIDYDYYIASSAPIYNLTIDDSNASGTFDVILTNIPVKGVYVTERLNPPLTISNDLTFTNNATLNSNNYEVQVAGDFDLTSTSTYTPGLNKTTFNGSGYQTFTGDGTITSGLYKLNINKSADTLIFDGVPATYTIRDSLEIYGGVLDDGGKTLNLAGHIYNAGEHTGTGKILLNGTGTQTLEASVFSSPTLGNLELSNGTDPGAQLISDFTASTLTLTANTGGLSIFDIQDSRLTLSGGVVQTSGTLAFGDDKMVLTSGASSAKGLKVSISLIGAGSPNYLFPIGVDDSGTNEYNPYELRTPGDPGTTTGTINVVPVNSHHPTVKTTSDVIQFYWKVDATGFAGADADGFQYYFDYFGQILSNQQKAAYLDYESVDGWVTANGTASKTTDDITFNTGLGFLSTDFTAGKQAAFNKPRILYSRASDDWHLITTWSETAFGGAQAAKAPLTYDRFIIGGAAGVNHIVDINTSLATIAGVEIYSSEATGIGGTSPTLNNPAGNTGVDLTSVSGGGRYVQNDNDLPSGDFGDFCNNDTAIFEYSTGTYDIPTEISVYPNLHITSNVVDRVKILPNASILVQNELVLSTASTGNTLRFNNAGGDLIVYGDVALDNEANLEFDGASIQNLNIYGDLDLDYDDSGTSANILSVNTGTAAHKINFYGDSVIVGASAINIANGTLSILDSLNTVIPDGTGSIILNKLTINKDNLTDTVKISEDFTLNGTTNSSPKALTLSNGTLILENTSTDVELSSSGAFNIPQTSALILKDGASVNVIGSNAGIFLDGLLSADSTSTINLGDGSTGDTRYIEYSGSGKAEIILTESANLTVNSQIRRSLSQTNGVLKFDQSGTTSTIIYGRGGSATRAKFEVINFGSEFNMTGGSFTILRGGGTTYGDLFLRPASGSATGGIITLGSVDVGSTQTIKFDANIPLNTLMLDGVGSMNTFQIMVNPLLMNGDLTINTTNSTLYANGIDVTLKGDLTNNGTYTPGTNTTTFDGTIQTILGTTVTDFYNLVCEPSTSLTFNYDVTVANDLSINSGTLVSSTYDIFVVGDIVNNGIHSGDADDGGLILNGTLEQDISGTGTFGRLNLYNPNGARISNAITLNQDLLLSDGVFNINQHLLTLGEDANIIDTTGTGFSSTKMIEPNGVFSDYGIKKSFPAVADTIIFPLGISGKYTPAILEIVSSDAGSVRIDCINAHHPTVVDDTEVLQYYWEVASSGISGFDGDLKFKYDNGDVAGTESDYVAARLVIPDGTTWSKATSGSDETDNVYEATDTIVFDFNGVDNLSGEYTAGADAAIPATVPTYTSNSDGDWDDINIWTPEAPAGGPNGFIVEISPGDSVNTNGNRRFAYRTTINGVLDVEDSYGHNLGTVDGTGRLRLEGPILPAGRFTSFLTCSGGILEYGGSGDYTIIADRLDTIRGIYFTGTGKRILPDKDLVICDTLKIISATLDNSVNERNLTINGAFQRLSSGAFLSGSNDATVIFAGSSPQTLGGADGEFTGTNGLNNFEINNSSGLTLNSPLEINKILTLTDGIITTTSTNILKMIINGDGDADGIVLPAAGGSSSSYIDGPMSKNLFGGKDFTFPIGDGSKYGVVQTLGVMDGTWKAEYFGAGHATSSVTGGLTAVSTSEYWAITNPVATNTAQVKLRWNSSSDITPLTTTNGLVDIVVAEFNGTNWAEIASNTPTDPPSDDYDGTVTTTNTIDIDPMYYTLGSTSAILAKAYFTVLDDVCNGTSISVSFSGVDATNLDYSLTYTIEGVPNVVAITSLPYSIPTAATGDYVLTAFTYNNGGNIGSVDGSTVTVNSIPAFYNVTGGGTICAGGAGLVVGLDGSELGVNYELFVGATSVGTYAGTGAVLDFGNQTVGGNYTVEAANATTTCSQTMTGSVNITANPLPMANDQIPADLCSEVTGENAQSTVDLTALNALINTDASGDLFEWFTNAALTIAVADDTNETINVTVNGGAFSETAIYYCKVTLVASGCTNTATVTYTVNRIPETGFQYHLP